MNLLRTSITSLALMAIAFTGFSQERKDTLKLSVAEAQKFALENNRAIKSSKIDIEIAKKKVWETVAIGLPQFAATADYQHIFKPSVLNFPTTGFTQDPLTGVPIGFTQFKDPATSLNKYIYEDPRGGSPLSPKDQTTFNFTLSQLVFSGEYLVGLQASKVYKELSERLYIKSEISTKESVSTSYYLVLVAEENLTILKESLTATDQLFNEMTKMNEQGLNEETDVDQIRINKSNLQILITSLEGQKKVASMLLKLQLGADFSQTLILTDSLAGIVNQGNLQYMANSVYDVEKNIDYELIKTQESLMALSFKREKSKFMPTVSAFYRHQELAKEPILNFQPKDIVGVSVNLPIFTSGQRISKVGQARLDLEKATLTKINVGQSLVMEFEKTQNDYQTAFSNFSSNKESMELSKKIYTKTVIKFRNGMASSIELTQNQNQFLTSESNYYNSVLNLLNAKAKLDKILSKY